MPDPKLKAAAKEIAAICKKYDIAASVVLQTPDDLEYLRVINPSWSVMYLMDTPVGPAIRFRSKLADFSSKEVQEFATTSTVSVVMGFMNQAGRDLKIWQQIAEMLGKKLGITHVEREDEDHHG